MKINELKKLLKSEEHEKKKNKVLWVFAIIGIIAAIAAVCYALYRYFSPDYLEDFDDERQRRSGKHRCRGAGRRKSGGGRRS